ncbi:MAG: mannonate dehydratase [Bryobacteraceae bacterium]|jgi:mannonate dehydratase
MHRRHFLEAAATALAAAGRAAGQDRPAGLSQGKLKLGTQNDSSDAALRILSAFGVNHICTTLPSPRMDANWSVEGLTRLRERVESFGIRLEMVPLPLSSSYIAHAENPNIMLGRSPERDREIDTICQMIRNAARAGIPALKYNLTILGVVRSEPSPGRGGAHYSTFVYEKAALDRTLTEAGPISADTAWERIGYFLKRVVPVAEEYKIRMACHPHDPGMPPGKGFRGVERVLGSVDGLKRFIEIAPSPYHGLNFCQGTISEMLVRPADEIFDVIRYFGARGKIFNVHFRNIKGGFLNFQETFPDDGDVNMIRAMRVYKEVGYDGMLMPDHVPAIDGDAEGKQAFAYAYGYIQALIQMVNMEA